MAAEMLTVGEARELILDQVPPPRPEAVAVQDALGRVLAAPVRAAGRTPPFDASAMDGYAIQPAPAGTRLRLDGESRAGQPASGAVTPGTAIRISTGAAVPAGALAVVRQEDVRVDSGAIELLTDVAAGTNVRRAGEDMRAGTPVLAAGTRIGPFELAAAVAAGAGTLSVARRPQVAVACTGDELRPPGAPLGPGEIHNSNGPMLAALVARAGAAPGEVVQLPDDLVRTKAALEHALAGADVLLISGGVSVGPHDHVKPALSALAVRERFWRVALQPGKPTWFGTRGATLVLGLPGNPVSAGVTFTLFAWPALAAMLGSGPPAPPLPTARLGQAVERRPGREQALRVRLHHTSDGALALPTGPQGSHIVTSLLGADALALIPAGAGELAAGTEVRLHTLPG